MKKQITTLMVALLTVLTVSGQVKDLHFTYDEAGNRIARDWK
jgi:YD repeat-containing protein